MWPCLSNLAGKVSIATCELPNASPDVAMTVDDEQSSAAAQGSQLTNVPAPFATTRAMAGLPSTTAPGLPATPQVETTWHGRDLTQIREGRLRADAYVTFCLNLSNAPGTDCAELVAARLNHSRMDLHVVCYPLRFRNVFLMEQSPTMLIGSFLTMVSPFGDIILISLHCEADGSSTFDVGFRFADEALCAWQKDGYRHEDHYWRISPVSSIGGHCCMVQHPSTPPSQKWTASMHSIRHCSWRHTSEPAAQLILFPGSRLNKCVKCFKLFAPSTMLIQRG
jgi:hypothetical protein